jgi:tRNA(Ile)-lysidine synthase
VCVGLSGGLDSMVLLALLHERAAARPCELTAVHVHHGLSPNADAWARFCTDECARRGIALDVVRVALDRASGRGLEGEARRERYAVYAGRPENVVALAHHLDDQAETVLLQLLRGTGLKGVAAMPRLRALNSRVSLYRPLLAMPRAQLQAMADARGLRWIEDESNASIAHDRNFVRHEVATLLDARFPGWRRSLARFARHAAAAQSLLDERAMEDGASPQAPGPLALDATLSPLRRANAVRAFLAAHDLAMPSEARLDEMARQLYDARADARVRIEHDGIAIVRHRGAARVERERPGSPWRVAWHGEEALVLGDGRGAVAFEPAVGAGLAARLTHEGDWYFAPRSGGERLRLDARRPTRTLKNLLQEHDVPLARRGVLPLLFRGGDLVWVPGIGIAAGYACEPGEPGLAPSWQVTGKPALC